MDVCVRACVRVRVCVSVRVCVYECVGEGGLRVLLVHYDCYDLFFVFM